MRVNLNTDRVYPIDYMFKKVESLTNLLENELSTTNGKVDEHAAQLGQKVSSENIKSIRDNAATFEYSLDGNVWKQVQGGGTGPNVKNLANYSQYKSGSNWVPAFTQAFADLTAMGGGVLQLPSGVHYISSTITIPSNIHIAGMGVGITIIQLTNGISADMITLDTSDNAGIRDLTIKGNAYSGPGSTDKDGLVIGRPGILSSDSDANMSNILIQNIEIRDIVGNGFHCYRNTWVYFISRVSISFCTGYGAFIESTDNLYDTFAITANGKAGLYIAGSNNRLSNMKIIFNGRGPRQGDGSYIGNGTDILSPGVYCGNGVRNTFINIECQENYGHGFVFDSARDADILGCVSDKNGYSIVQDNGAGQGQTIKAGFSKSAVGYYFMNGSARLTGIIKATNFNSGLVTQDCGYFIDSTCSNISLQYEEDATQTGVSANLSYTSTVTKADARAIAHANSQLNEFLQSGLSLTNKITAYDTNVFQFSTNMMNAGYTIAGSEITGQTAWAQSSPRLGTKSNLTTTIGKFYLVRVKVKPATDNYTLKLTAYWDEAPYNAASTAGSLQGVYKSGVYTDMSFIFKATRTSSAFVVWLEDKGLNGTQGAITAAEFAVIDITDLITAYSPKTIDKVVSTKYFIGAKTFNGAGTPKILDSGATAGRPLMPKVGQEFYDTTLGKPIYCNVGGATPTWKDAAGTTV